jgi:hypothetical protein
MTPFTEACLSHALGCCLSNAAKKRLLLTYPDTLRWMMPSHTVSVATRTAREPSLIYGVRYLDIPSRGPSCSPEPDCRSVTHLILLSGNSYSTRTAQSWHMYTRNISFGIAMYFLGGHSRCLQAGWKKMERLFVHVPLIWWLGADK